MIEKLSNLIRRLVILLAACAAVGVLLLLALFSGGAEIEGTFSSSLVDSETVYLMLALLVLLPLSLAVLLHLSIKTVKALRRYHDLKTGKRRRGENNARFSMLNRLDEEYAHYKAPAYEKERSLARFCEDFRNYAASRHGLYYDIEDIRRFVAGLSVTRLIILQGMSGTGKTSLAYAFGKFIKNDSVIVPVQPMWKERSDIIGYFNEFTKKFNETTFLRKIYEAGYKKEMYITVLDEVNISRIEYYFAEFLSLLEIPDVNKRYLDVVSDVWETDPQRLVGGKILLPPNMWFVGTANNDDSTFAISDKVYDRAMVLNLDKKSRAFEATAVEAAPMSYDRFCELVEEAQRTYHLSERQMENIRRLDAYLIERFRLSFGNRIMKQIQDYVPVYMACGGTELEALDDIFSKKILRKLEAQAPSYVRNEAPILAAFIEDVFGQGNMKACLRLLARYEITA